MLLELIATGLLAYGVSTSIVNVNHGNNHDYHNESNENALVRNESFNLNNYYQISGVYNFKDTFNFSSYDFESEDSDVLRFEEINYSNNIYSVPFSLNDSIYYLNSISFRTDYYNDDSSLDLRVRFYYYDNSNNHYSNEITIYDSTALSDYTSNVLYNTFFNVCNTQILSDYESEYFSAIFMKADNQYLFTYSGYYSFVDNSQFTQKFVLLGNLTFDTKVYYGFSNSFYGGTYSNQFLNFFNYDSINSTFGLVQYQYPFNTTKVVSNNILIASGKMTLTTKAYLNSIGVFAYQRDTNFDDTDFHTLLFSIMDSPIYMLSRLLNFELFGVNLFVAVTGLLTLAIMVVVIRRIW